VLPEVPLVESACTRLWKELCGLATLLLVLPLLAARVTPAIVEGDVAVVDALPLLD